MKDYEIIKKHYGKDRLLSSVFVAILHASYIVLFFPDLGSKMLNWGFYVTSVVYGGILIGVFELNYWRGRYVIQEEKED